MGPISIGEAEVEARRVWRAERQVLQREEGGSVFLLECRAVGDLGGAYSIARLTAELHLGHESLQIAVLLRIDLSVSFV